MRRARIDYPTGREVLAAYWGYLSSGGLIIEPATAVDESSLADGDDLVLEVRIASLRKHYTIPGRVRGRINGRPVVAFEAGHLQDLLLAAAWADSHGVPERRHRRWEVNLPVRYRAGDAEGDGRMLNISRGGCLLEADAPLRFGARVHLEGEDFAGGAFTVDGKVRWFRTSPRRQTGIEFSTYQDDLVARLNRG